MNYSAKASVPFAITDINHGFQEAKGLLSVSEKGIDLEFQIKDALVGIIKSEVKNVHIPYEALEAITFKKGWFSSKITLQTTTMRALEEVPGSEQGECTLKVKRDNRGEAQRIISRARLQLTELHLDRLDAHE